MRIYLTLIRPVFTYASETWTFTEKDEMRLRVFERQILQKILGPIQIGKDIWRIRNNAELDQVINAADIVRFNKAERVKWLGHIQRMDTSRIAKRIFVWKPIGRRSLGRRRLRRLDVVCDDLKLLKVRNWKELAMGRKVWNDLSEKAKNRQRVIVLMVEEGNGIFLEGLMKTTKDLSQDSRFPGRDLNPGPPEYEAVVLTTQPRCSMPP
jgi:hypothetical protein